MRGTRAGTWGLVGVGPLGTRSVGGRAEAPTYMGSSDVNARSNSWPTRTLFKGGSNKQIISITAEEGKKPPWKGGQGKLETTMFISG